MSVNSINRRTLLYQIPFIPVGFIVPTIFHEFGHMFFVLMMGGTVDRLKFELSWFPPFFGGIITASHIKPGLHYWLYSFGGVIFEIPCIAVLLYIGYKENIIPLLMSTHINLSFTLVASYCDFPPFDFRIAQLWYLVSYIPLFVYLVHKRSNPKDDTTTKNLI